MATKKIVLDFKQQPIVGTSFQYKIYINGVALTYLNGLNYLNLNYKSGGNNSPFQIGLGADLDETIDNTLAFLSSLYSANSSAGDYVTTMAYARVGDTIEATITSSAPTNSLITVWEVLSDDDYIFIRPDNPCEAIYFSNGTSANAEPCFDLTPGTYYIKNITLNTTQSVVIPSTFDCLFQKGYSYAVQEAGEATLFTFNVTASITIANLNLVLTNNTLTIDVVATNAFLQFSLDGITYQDETIFTDMPMGESTLYVRDAYRCVKTFLVTNDGETNGNITTPYTYISESNSLRFIKRVTHENCGNYKNQFNTLSCEENLQIPNKFTQLFQGCDTIKTQVKTSYQNVEVYAKNNAGTFTEITATKIVNNIQIEDKRDCTYYTYNGQLAVLFTAGNTYDYDTTDVNGTYVLNGALPAYGTIGTWVETDYGTMQIANIRLADNGERSLIFNININLLTPVAGTIQTIYNRESYDIWEFDTNMSLFLDTTITIGVRFYQTDADVNFPDVFWISEKISVKTRWERSIEVIWSNSKNTDIYFYSGIIMKNRLNHAFINTELSDGDVEIQKTDSQVISIDATNYNALEFEVLGLTTGMVRKLKLALKHDNLIIENVPYKLAENPETERQGQSNFYRLKAKLLEAGDVWNQGTANTQVIYSNVELIGLLQGDEDAQYIRTQ